MTRDELDLSGLWHGFYNYPVPQKPVAFTATLADAGGTITGATEETGQVGDAAGLAMTATVQGRRMAATVTWLKIYDGAFEHYDAVRYEGRISEDGLEIEGKWTVPGHWSGTFLMIRSGGPVATTDIRIAEPI